jgi:signal transduction histidine kinase
VINNCLQFYGMDMFTLVIMYIFNRNNTAMMKALNRLLLATKRSEKAKDVFIGAMSHEFRNPLNSILCSLEVLRGTCLDSLNKS